VAQRILIVTENPVSFGETEQLLKAKGYDVHLVSDAEQAIALLRGLDFSVVIAPLRLNRSIRSGLHVLTEHELLSPGKGKILVIDRWSKNIATTANFIGATCVPAMIPANALLQKIERLLNTPPET
jgi:DNA-binding NtrC family response regulator